MKHSLFLSFCVVFYVVAIIGFAGCSKQEPTAAKSGDHDHGHAHDEGHAHADEPDAHGDHGHADHGPAIELGTATIGGWTVRAARDQGEIKPGGDAPIDVWLTGGTSKIIAVRFWIGVESAAGSIKARAEIETPAEPNRWHTHAEVPSPLPAGSRLWVEIESEGQGKQVGSFDLKS